MQVAFAKCIMLVMCRDEVYVLSIQTYPLCCRH